MLVLGKTEYHWKQNSSNYYCHYLAISVSVIHSAKGSRCLKVDTARAHPHSTAFNQLQLKKCIRRTKMLTLVHPLHPFPD